MSEIDNSTLIAAIDSLEDARDMVNCVVMAAADLRDIGDDRSAAIMTVANFASRRIADILTSLAELHDGLASERFAGESEVTT